jgi:hypothetical protein
VAFSILSHVGGNSTVEAMNVRDLFSQYFISPEGSIVCGKEVLTDVDFSFTDF